MTATQAGGSAPSSVSERVGAAFAVLALVAAGVGSYVYGGRMLPASPGALPAAFAAGFVAMMVSAAILRDQFRTSHRLALSLLSNVFALGALLGVPYVLSLPHVFTQDGFNLGNASSSWLWVLWHGGVTLLVVAYVIAAAATKDMEFAPEDARETASMYSLCATGAAALLVAASIIFHAKLPALGLGSTPSPLFSDIVERVLLCGEALALISLTAVTRLRNTTDLWLALMLVAFTVETYVSAMQVHGEFTIAWYVAAFGIFAWQAMFLFVQLRHANQELAALTVDKKSLIEVTLRDALTGLLNRRGFDERFEDIAAASRLANKPFSLVIFDLDAFKNFNDEFGHPAGDDALRLIGEAVAKVVVRPTDACCRVGGEEFAIVLGETDQGGAMTVAERIRAEVLRLRIPRAADADTGTKFLSVSVGIATADPTAVVDGIELYERADRALYKAKRMGRNRISGYDRGEREAPPAVSAAG